MLSEDAGLLRLIEEHGVQSLIGEGLKAGVGQRRRDWAVEMSLFQSEGLGAGVGGGGGGWGEQEVGVSSGGAEYHEESMRWRMGVCVGGGGRAGDEVVVVASSGSGGDGVGVGVVVGRVGSVQELARGAAGESGTGVVYDTMTRVPGEFGSRMADGQFAEDVGGVKGLMACVRAGGVLLVIGCHQTVRDIVEAGEGRVVMAREAVQHRCGTVRWMMR